MGLIIDDETKQPHTTPTPQTFAGLSSPSPFVNLLSMSDFLPLAWRERKTKIALLIVAFRAEAKKKTLNT